MRLEIQNMSMVYPSRHLLQKRCYAFWLPKFSFSDCEVAMVWDIHYQIRSGPFYSEILIDSISRALFPEPWLCGDEGRILIGQQLVNPLLLLGQYSDDETEDGSGKSSHECLGKSLLVDSKDQVEESSGPGESCDPVEVYLDSNLDQQKVVELEGVDSICMDDPHILGGADAKDDDLTVLKEADLGEPSLLPNGSEAQVVGDVNSSWKLVMHGESGQYYYWNTETGDTSWEAPAVFLQTAQPSAQEYSAPQYNGVESNPDSSYTNDVMQNFSFPGDALLEIKESVGDGYTQSLVGGYHKCVHCGRDVDKEVKDCEAENNSWAYTMISLSEHLEERLKSLQSANGVLHGEDWIANYILELKIRRSDFKSLSSCDLSLNPFWLHSEAQLRRLELAINGQAHETDKFNSSVQVEDANESLPTGTIKLECGETELIKENKGKEASPDMENGSCENLTGKARVTAETGFYEVLNDDKGADSSSKQSGIGLEEGELIENVGHPNTSGPTSSQDGEDIDMDVDMEVEDVVSDGVVLPPPEPLPLTTEGFFTMPPPPDGEWIPPPPPEAEQIPPPPPDEPPPSYPATSYTGVGQPFTYADYAVPYNYIHGDIVGSNFYVHAEGGQVVQPDVSISYGAVAGIYGDATHIPVNSVEPIIYYSLQDGAVSSVDGLIPVESTQVQLHSRPSSNSSLLTDQAGSSYALPEVSSKSSLGNSSFSGKTENKDSDPLSTSLTGTSTSTIVRESMAVSLGNRGAATVTANALATSADTKKVSRNKKRAKAVAPTLRSNKKVSSLVDKWKAAKDELQEEEEEEDEANIALSILEKKRQREIEGWRAKQIASGDAKDNANFQPLGSDWRARVKRKRAQTAGKVVETEEPVKAGNQQADIAEITRQLPSGWQAYWDESSKQVYYGNTITSETSWTRPTT